MLNASTDIKFSGNSPNDSEWLPLRSIRFLYEKHDSLQKNNYIGSVDVDGDGSYAKMLDIEYETKCVHLVRKYVC